MTSPGALMRRALVRITDRLRFSRAVGELTSIGHLGLHIASSGGRIRTAEPARSDHLFAAARHTRSARIRRLLGNALAPLSGLAADTRPRQPTSALPRETVQSVLLLKPPGPDGEKGVLFAGNEGPWPALVRVAERTDLLRRYDLVALSAWSPPKYQKLAAFAGLSPDPVLIGISNIDDLEGYRLLAPAIEPMPLMASDWLDPDDFRPRPRTERDIDILMVAGWGRYKRHWLLFEALRALPRGLTVALIGRDSDGRTLQDVKAEARLFGVRQELIFLSDLPIHDVYDYQARARVSVIFSGREGACVAVTESFFADTPVGLMGDAHVGSKRHINAATGTLFSRGHLTRQLGDFLDNSDSFTARQWASRNISCHASSTGLNQILRTRAEHVNRPWTRDIAPLFRRYFVPRYVNTSDRDALSGHFEALRESYGLSLELPTD